MPIKKYNKTMKKLCLISLVNAALVLSYVPAKAFTKDQVGTSGGKFLQIGVNARAIGMGEAYSSVTDGADSIYWNPAGLASVEKNSVSVMHAFYFQTTSFDFVSYARRINKLGGTIGIGVQYFSAGSIDRTSDVGVKNGTFNPQDLAITLGWGHTILDRASHGQSLIVGVSGKYIQSKIIETAKTGAADVGVTWSPYEKFAIAAGAQNIGGKLKFVKESDSLPLNVRLGSSYKLFPSLLVAMDLNFPNDNGTNVGLGAEYTRLVFKDISFSGRAGYNSTASSDIDGLSSISAGLGAQWRAYNLDFAWVPFGELGDVYRISLGAKF